MIRKMPGVSLRSGRARTDACRAAELGRADRHEAVLGRQHLLEGDVVMTLQHITASPSKIGDIARAALILTHFEHGYIT